MKKSDQTRKVLLEKAFELIYKNGYQATSVDEILATTNVTKGAFYYHFKNKDEMGLAVINDVMYPQMHQEFVSPLQNSDRPARDIYKMINHLLFEIPFMKAKYGCPASNLVQEMSPLNVEFSRALSKLTDQWNEALQACINNGKVEGRIRKDIDAEQVSCFIMSGYWGVRNLGKLSGRNDSFTIYLNELKRYLKSLK